MLARLRAQGRFRRVLFIPGPGDVIGTFRHWQAGEDDPRLPGIAYSAQVYDVVDGLGAELLTLTEALPDGEEERVEEGRITFRGLRQGSGRGVGFHLAELLYLVAIRAQIRAFAPDLILTQRMFLHFWLFPTLAGRIPVMPSLHNTFHAQGRPPGSAARLLARLNGRRWARAFPATFVASDAIAAQLRSIAGADVPGIALQLPLYGTAGARAASRPPAEDRPYRLVYLGRIEREKGVFDLLEAVASLELAIDLSFAGTGGAEVALVEAISTANLSTRVRCLGALDGSAIFALLAKSDLLACPTRPEFPEGFAMVVSEAALAGLPVVASDAVPAAAHVGSGVLIHRAGDPADLARAIAKAHGDWQAGTPLTIDAEAAAAFTDPGQALGSRIVEALDQTAPL